MATRWEYVVVELPTVFDRWAEELNRRGAEGWEVVSVVGQSAADDGRPRALCKRLVTRTAEDFREYVRQRMHR